MEDKYEPLTPENEKLMDDKLSAYMEASETVSIAYEEVRIANEKEANDFWDSLSYDDKCNAFHAVVSRLFDGDIKQRGSYRYVLYDVFGFKADMYVRGMDCGYMALHNSIMTDEQFNEANKWMLE
jgi:hypothetical protein